MRWLAALVASAAVVVTAASAASAHPRRRELDIMEAAPPPEPCLNGKSWKQVKTCLGAKNAVKEVYAAAKAKVVELVPQGNTTSKLVWVYAEREPGTWTRIAALNLQNATNELLGATAFDTANGKGLRVDIAARLRTSFMLDQTGPSTAGVLRRRQTTVCVPTAWSCRTMISSCEAYVNGRSYWSYRTEPVWDVALGIRLKGNAEAGSGVCTAPKNLLVEAVE